MRLVVSNFMKSLKSDGLVHPLQIIKLDHENRTPLLALRGALIFDNLLCGATTSANLQLT